MSAKIRAFIMLILGLPKTLFFNIRYFGIRGLRLPVLLSFKVKLKSMWGRVQLPSSARFGMIKIGFPGSEIFDDSNLNFIWINHGTIKFKGKASIRNGSVIRNNGYMEFGDNFQVSSPSTFICYKKIEFGDNCLIGWNCQFSDGDAHKIVDKETGNIVNENNEIVVGNKVWFGAFCRVYKGVHVPDYSVIAANTILTKSFSDTNSVIGGMPNHIIRGNIEWIV